MYYIGSIKLYAKLFHSSIRFPHAIYEKEHGWIDSAYQPLLYPCPILTRCESHRILHISALANILWYEIDHISSIILDIQIYYDKFETLKFNNYHKQLCIVLSTTMTDCNRNCIATASKEQNKVFVWDTDEAWANEQMIPTRIHIDYMKVRQSYVCTEWASWIYEQMNWRVSTWTLNILPEFAYKF